MGAERAGPSISSSAMSFAVDVVVVGGCGHVGLPLAIAFADRGLRTVAFDVNPDAVALVGSGTLPFDEPDAPARLAKVLADGTFTASADAAVVADAENVVIVIGTPVDEHLNPDAEAVPRAIEGIAPRLRRGQLLVLRSTVYPGVTAMVERLVERLD